MTLGWQQMFTVMLWLSSVLFWLFLILTPPSLLISLSRSRHPPPVHLTLSLRYVLSPPVALGCFSLYFFALCLSLSLSIFPLALSLSVLYSIFLCLHSSFTFPPYISLFLYLSLSLSLSLSVSLCVSLCLPSALL